MRDLREHEYEYQTHGQDNQVLEIRLGPGQPVHAENGSMCFMDRNIRMSTGVGRKRGLWSIFKRRVSGESILLSIFQNHGDRPAVLGLNPSRPAHIEPVSLDERLPDVICWQGAFLAGHPDVRVTVALASLKTSVFGGGSLIMQRLHGVGQVFLTGNGAIVQKDLEPEETYLTEPEALVGFEETVDYGAELFRGGSNLLWSGENVFALRLTGPGRVWFQPAAKHQIRRAASGKNRAKSGE